MEFLSEDDLSIGTMTTEELTAAWWFWFGLAQATNDSDELCSHGCLRGLTRHEYEHGVADGPEKPVDTPAPCSSR